MRLLGAVADQPDQRDHILAAKAAKLPSSFVLPFLPQIRDQGQQPSCTGHAGAWAWQQFLSSRFPQYRDIAMSASFIWYHARLEDGRETEVTGASLRSVMKALNKKGCPSAWIWPDSKPATEQPDGHAAIAGAALRLPEYVRCKELGMIRHAIAVERQSVLLSVPVFPSWTSREVERIGRIRYEPSAEQELGGHAVVACGYDDQTGSVMVANSWGPRFGDNGFLHIPYELLEWESWDGWTVNFNSAPDAL